MTIEDCISIIRAHRELCERRTPGHCPPLIAAGWGGRLQLIATAPRVDRDLGLQGAWSLRCAINPECLLFSADVYGARLPSPEHRLRPGELQRRAEAGGLDSGEVHQAMAAYLVDAAGRIESAMLPYESGSGIRWRDRPETENFGGYLPETLTRMMTQRVPIDAMLDAAAEAYGLAGDKRRHHQANAARHLLRMVGFTVMDITGG